MHATLTAERYGRPPVIPLAPSVSAEPAEDPSCWKKAYNWFCGFEQSAAPELSPEEQAELQKKLTDTSEDPVWRNVVNANAIILLTVAVFFYAYFG